MERVYCKDCDWWFKAPEMEGVGTCQYNPPAVVMEHVNANPEGTFPKFIIAAVSRFPSTSGDSYCHHGQTA